MQQQENDSQQQYERGLLRDLLFESYKEQRRKRRWGNLFKALFLAYFIWLALLLIPSPDKKAIKMQNYAALIDMRGMIADSESAGADNIVTSLREAFKDKNTKGVILRINSPGGSAVQSAYMYDEIRRLKEKYPDKPIYAVIVDIGASGAYYVASATDAIFADRSSLVGSIGVLMNGFGFVDTMEKLGVERRLITAGKNKAFLDPFSPEKPNEVAFAKGLVEDIHQEFINSVKQGRGDRLKDNPEIFSGLIWTGARAKDLGLIDGFGSASFVARELLDTEEIVDFTPSKRLIEKLAERLGTSFSSGFATALGVNKSYSGVELR